MNLSKAELEVLKYLLEEEMRGKGSKEEKELFAKLDLLKEAAK